MKNCYYFSISAQFKTDYDVKKLEEIFGVKAKKLTYFKDSVSPIKSAKFLFYTKDFEEEYSDNLFAEFISGISKKAVNIKNELIENDGELTFCIVFKNFVEKPCLFLSNETLTNLSNMGASYDVDFI